MKKVWPILRYLDANGEKIFILITLVYIFIITLVSIFQRYVLIVPNQWADETSSYVFVYLIYIGAAYGVKFRGHIRIDLLLRMMKRNMLFLSLLFSDICLFTLIYYVIVYSISMFALQLERGQMMLTLNLNMAYAQFAVPFGWSLITMRAIQRVYGLIADYRSGKNLLASEFDIIID